MQEYNGSVYPVVSGSELEIGEARDSIQRIRYRPGDNTITFCRATKGFEARNLHINNFLETEHDFMFFMDHDQLFPSDILERLRSHKLPYVSGLYMRRHYEPIAPVWYEDDDEWPKKPFLDFGTDFTTLRPLGGSGWGCILVHRDVILAVQKLLKGEQLVLEDDMDIWPYDLAKIMEAVYGLEELIPFAKSLGERGAWQLGEYVNTLKQEIRPLRVYKSHVGSDIRFPFYAKKAGYQLMGDPQAVVGHFLHYPISFENFKAMGDENIKTFQEHMDEKLAAARAEHSAATRKVMK